MDTATTRSARTFVPPILFAAALGLVAWKLLGTVSSAVRDTSSDDGFYLRYMQAVREGGLSVLPGLFDAWNADARAWIFPPPSRIGFILASVAWSWIFGATIQALQYLSLASHLVGAIVNYGFARRHLGEPRALLAGALWAFSPLLMGLSRLALTDSFIALCTSVALWLFLEMMTEPASFRRRALFGCAFGFMVLVKELTVLLLVPLVALVLVERFWRRRPLPLAGFALTFAASGVAVAAIVVLAAGGPSTLLETARIVMASPATNAYAIQYGSGPWFRYLIDFLCLSPWTTVLAIGFLGVLVSRLRAGEYERPLVLLALVAAFLVLELSFFTKNVRYAVALELPIRVFAVCMLGEMAKTARPVRSTALVALAVILLCWIDWRSFDLFWVRYRGYDPVTQWLIGVRHMMPFPYR